MNKMILAGISAISLLTVPAAAQENEAGAYDMNTTQQQIFMTWPDEQRISYTRWPVEVQAYYWTLTPQQQTGWWVLTDDQRNRIYVATPEQRTQAWASIAAQMTRAPMSEMPTRAASAMMSGGIRWVSTPVVQSIAGDQAAPYGGKVPICGPAQYDNCMNAWEAGKRGPNVTRPLSYWPGGTADRPAGE